MVILNRVGGRRQRGDGNNASCGNEMPILCLRCMWSACHGVHWYAVCGQVLMRNHLVFIVRFRIHYFRIEIISTTAHASQKIINILSENSFGQSINYLDSHPTLIFLSFLSRDISISFTLCTAAKPFAF